MIRDFTATECGGWCINVNHPTELQYPTLWSAQLIGLELYISRLGKVFFKQHVGLWIFTSTCTRILARTIDLATLGIAWEEAKAIKRDPRPGAKSPK